MNRKYCILQILLKIYFPDMDPTLRIPTQQCNFSRHKSGPLLLQTAKASSLMKSIIPAGVQVYEAETYPGRYRYGPQDRHTRVLCTFRYPGNLLISKARLPLHIGALQQPGFLP